jgi:hypothetical protein
MSKRKIIISFGEKYGNLSTVKEIDSILVGRSKKRFILCKCICGNIKTYRLEYLRSGHTKSCGCNRLTISAKSRITHGESGTRLHNIWSLMLSRCRNKNRKDYKNYGGRGISVCFEWYEYKRFKDWAILNGYEKKLTIERIDNNGNYCPGNCKFATMKEQANNRRNNKLLNHNGITLTIAQWSERLGFKSYIIDNRIRRGWTTERALSMPVRRV